MGYEADAVAMKVRKAYREAAIAVFTAALIGEPEAIAEGKEAMGNLIDAYFQAREAGVSFGEVAAGARVRIAEAWSSELGEEDARLFGNAPLVILDRTLNDGTTTLERAREWRALPKPTSEARGLCSVA
jgi:hypothetical protein